MKNKMQLFARKVDTYFGVSEKKSKISTEIIAGLVTFLTMSYILTLNPTILTDGNTKGALWASIFIATIFGAFIGTLLMAFVAKMPFAQAPGLGLNNAVAAMIGTGMSLGFKCSFGNAMLIVFISGLIFLILSFIKIKGVSIREIIYVGMPNPVKKAMSIGIGLFIAFIGLKNAGVIQVHEGSIGLISFTDYTKEGGVLKLAPALVCLFGFISIVILEKFKVKGGVIIGIILATLIGIPLKVTTYSGMDWNFTKYFANYFSFQGNSYETGAIFFSLFTEGFKWDPSATVFPIIMSVISFCMIDMFDTMGTAVGCCQTCGLVDEKGDPLHYNTIMISDSAATCIGAILGTSTITTFSESGAGVAAGGRTGLTALTTSICFLLSLFFMPIIASIPSAAAASALVYVGCLMFSKLTLIDTKEIKDLVPAFLTVLMMPLTFSITNGIGFGILSYVLIEGISFIVSYIIYRIRLKKASDNAIKPILDIHPVCFIVFVLYALYFFMPTKF